MTSKLPAGDWVRLGRGLVLLTGSVGVRLGGCALFGLGLSSCGKRKSQASGAGQTRSNGRVSKLIAFATTTTPYTFETPGLLTIGLPGLRSVARFWRVPDVH